MRCWPELLIVLLCGCSETALRATDEAPIEREQLPPDWTSCEQGLVGRDLNLPADHPAVQEEIEASPSGAVSFERLDPSLDFGGSWWPVDEGLAEDPAWFSVAWTGWLKADGATATLLVAATDDLWIHVDGVELLHVSEGWAPAAHELGVGAGEHQLSITFAHHRAEASGLSLRPLDDTRLCPGVERAR